MLKKITITLSEKNLEELKQKEEELKISKSEIIRRLLDKYLKKE
jgi:metal-responsive CopG/Arc/MetJ family transcriptional regulator